MARSEVRPGMRGELFDGYEHEGFFDEAFEADGLRPPPLRGPHQAPVGADARPARRPSAVARRGLPHRGHHLHRVRTRSDDDGIERTFPMDLLPRLIPGDEWQHIERGLVQRVTALNPFLDDLYVGERAAIHDGIVPSWLVSARAASSARASGSRCRKGARCLVAGIDLVRDADGTYCVLEDNLRNPSGISYVLENRASMTRCCPRVFAATTASARCDHYGKLLLDALRRVRAADGRRATPPSSCSPRACSTPPTSSTRSSRGRWASSWSRGATSSSTTTWCRCARPTARSESTSSTAASTTTSSIRCVFRADSTLGVPGLMAAARAGNVTHRQRGRQRRGRRQGGLRLRARPHPLLPRRGADPARTSTPTCCGTKTSGPTCSTGSTSWS